MLSIDPSLLPDSTADLDTAGDARNDADAPPAGDDKPIKDADALVLSDDDMALLKQMSPEGQAMLMGLMSGEAAEHEAMELAASTAAANAEGADIAEQGFGNRAGATHLFFAFQLLVDGLPVEIEKGDAEETEDLPGDHHGETDVEEEAFE